MMALNPPPTPHPDEGQKTGKILIIAASVLVGALAVAVLSITPPTEARLEAQDTMRSHSLQQLRYAIRGYWSRQKALPEQLTALKNDSLLNVDKHLTDPVTNQMYEYRITGAQAWEICATFARPGDGNDYYHHAAGRVCFQDTAEEK